MADAIQVATTTGTAEDAERIARALVEQRLAACVQIEGPITSWFRWQGRIDQAREWRCVIKTRRALYPRVESAIRELHPYDEPEIIALAIIAGSSGYLGWLDAETGEPGVEPSESGNDKIVQ